MLCARPASCLAAALGFYGLHGYGLVGSVETACTSSSWPRESDRHPGWGQSGRLIGPGMTREPSRSASEAGNGGHMAKDRSVTSSQAALTLGFQWGFGG